MKTSINKPALVIVAAIAVLTTSRDVSAYDSPYYSYASLAGLAASGISGTCTNPNFSQAPSDGIGQFFGLQAENSDDLTSIGYSIGRYTPSANAYQGYFVDNTTIQNGVVNETFYPFTNRPAQSAASFALKYMSGNTANAYINGTAVLTGLNQVQFNYDAATAGLHQEKDTNGSPLVFADFTSGTYCSALTYTSGSAVSWPAALGGNLVREQSDPPNEKTVNGTYSNAQYVVSH